jgi:hypothetical protein
MALPFFVESAPRAYRLKAGNADPILFNIPRDIPIPPWRLALTQTCLCVVSEAIVTCLCD